MIGAAVAVATFIGGYRLFGGDTTAARLALPLTGIAVGLVFMVWKITGTRETVKQGFPAKDELTMLIEGKAGRIAFMVGNYFMLALMWYTFIHEVILKRPPLEAAPVLILAMLFQVGVYAVARVYFFRRR